MDISVFVQHIGKALIGIGSLIIAFCMHLYATQLQPVLPTVPIDSETATTTNQFPASATTTSASVPKTAAKPATPKTETPTASAQASVPAPAQKTPAIPDETLNTMARAAIVNVLCTTLTGGSFKPISGSGVMIDGSGVVLTNAHVAQFFLLRDYYRPGNVTCTIRTGSPAINTYTAQLLYLPPAWIDANANQIVSSEATGTGENDFAFLLITGPYNPNNALPSTLPHIGMSTASADVGDRMLLAAYPAGFLSGELISTQLYASSAFAYVTQLFSFDSTSHVDLFSVGGSIESQAGSSGGAVLRGSGTLAGIISTAILKGSTGQRDLRAISIDYINRALKAQGQGGIVELLSGDLVQKAADFNQYVAPGETAKLEKVLNAQ